MEKVDFKKIVDDGLDITRKNLLDLSARNRLLNFKHSGAKILRFVDEVPNHIYSDLVEGSTTEIQKGFQISPVPLPKKSDLPELFEDSASKKPDVKAYAKKLGINTEWEMSSLAASVEGRHIDDKLQTLHFPEDLDRIVRRIQSEARTAIEESGVNMLFLCLGFLKWKDKENSDIYYSAPLIMIPIEIEREKVDARTGFAKFRLRYTGEDILDNICLREKLAQMAISLPSYEEFENPETYFSSLVKQLEDIKPDWSIQRFITLGFLSFGKMLMYQDLDPSKWGGKEGIAEATHILDIFSGNHSSEGSIAGEYDIDSDKDGYHISQVMDADSSQHSAILDVLSGKNLVIEGPPGTGKSQTITNLIAACLENGKTVLFVAEKMAALEVVRKRLDSIELGDFCLELHSHKTQKKAMLTDIKKRIELNKSSFRSASSNAEVRLHELNQKKAKLIEYCHAVNEPFGGTRDTPHQIFWKTEVLQSKLSKPYKAENFIALQNIKKITHVTIRDHIAILQNLSDNIYDYFGGDSDIKNHYWHGLNIAETVDYSQQQDIYRDLEILNTSANEALNALNELQLFGYSNHVFKNFPELLNRLKQLKQTDFEHTYLFHKLELSNSKLMIEACLEKLISYQKILEDYIAALENNQLKDDQLNSLDKQIIKSSKLPKYISFNELKSNSLNLDIAIKSFNKAIPVFKEAASYLGLSDSLNSIPALNAIIKVSLLCKDLDKNELALRNPVIENAITNEIIESLLRKVVDLREQRTALEEVFNFAVLPSLERLVEISEALHNKKLLSTLSSSWRAARADYRKIAKNDLAKDSLASAAKLDKLISYIKEAENFKQNAALITILPGIFKGIDTDIESLNKAILHYTKLRSELLSIPTYGAKIYNILRSLESHLYEWFTQNCSTLIEGINNLNTIKLNVELPADTELNVDSLISNCVSFIEEHKKIEIVVNAASINLNLSLNSLIDALNSQCANDSVRIELNNNSLFKSFNFTTQREKLSEQISILTSLKNTVHKIGDIAPPSMFPHVLCANGYDNIQTCVELVSKLCSYQEVLKVVQNHALKPNNFNNFWGYDKNKDKELLEAIIAKLATLASEQETFAKWCEILNGFADVKNAGLDGVITRFINSTTQPVSFADYVPLYHYLVYYALSHEALRSNNVLGSFSRITHENTRVAFKEIDIELQKLNARRLAYDISRRSIPSGDGGRTPKEFTDAKLINHELGKQKAHIPIRQLVNRAYDALVAMKPCFMMSPLSAAQYIHPHHKKFDILIMDEASQVKPADAIGVLARAKQVVIVGDSNQLPPTSFFDTIGTEEDSEEETTIQDSESILDVCKPLFQPNRRLRWHYRSQHQSLISFSNNHFYGNDLIIFPSPTAHSNTYGVKHVYVADGIYNNQSNLIEAKKVVAELMEMISLHPDLSYGVVTLNAKQKMVIEDEVERARKENPLFDDYVSKSENTDEKLFVKNLENVQGDERDVIFISTTFGLDDNGTFRQNFGPINGKDGWRRLNVLFTRAKQHVRIFSSFMPERIKVDDTKEQRGLRALKDYLHFAITGTDNHSYLTGQEPDSDFERAVGEFLKNQGYEVVYQLGVAGYRIDMVLKHPQCPTDYFIAIECDGATYHSARTARDRDRLREDNLRKLGWDHIHRIWSTDWFKQREREEKRLLEAVTFALDAKKVAA